MDRPPLSSSQQQQQLPAPLPLAQQVQQLQRVLKAHAATINELSHRADRQEESLQTTIQRLQSTIEDLRATSDKLAFKQDRRLTPTDRLQQQPVPELTIDEWLSECDVAYWLEHLYGGDSEKLAVVKPARAITLVLEAFVNDWHQRQVALLPAAASDTSDNEQQQQIALPPIRGAKVGKGRMLFWFVATNWNVIAGSSGGGENNGGAEGEGGGVLMDGNASILLNGGGDGLMSVVPRRGPAATTASTAAATPSARMVASAMRERRLGRVAAAASCAASCSGAATWRSSSIVDADAMSEISDASALLRGMTPRFGHADFCTPRGPAAGMSSTSMMMSPPPASTSLVGAAVAPTFTPLEGVWHRMEVRTHWEGVVGIMFDSYSAYIDEIILRAPKDHQVALYKSRAKCCNRTEIGKMRVAFFDAIAKIPGAVLA